MQVLAVGQPYDLSIKEWPEGCLYNYDNSGHWLHYLLSHPSELEKSSIQKGEATFGLYVRGPVIFLVHRFGEMLWQDAPYSWWLVSEEFRHIPDVSEGLHALLKVVMVDTATGLVAALRALTFSADFTKKLHEAIVHQSQQPFCQSRYDAAIREVYSRLSTEELVGLSEVFCKGGE